MKHTVLPALVGIILSSFVLTGCEGAQGPAGPAGPQGTQGTTGPLGPIGNANIISGRSTLTNADWSTTTAQTALSSTPGQTNFSRPARFADIAVPEVTADVLEGGAVLVYMQMTSDGVFQQLPVRWHFIASTIERNYISEITAEQIRILFYYLDLNDPGNLLSPLSPDQPTRTFRWVIIPPAAAAQLQWLPVNAGPEMVVRALAERGFTVQWAR